MKKIKLGILSILIGSALAASAQSAGVNHPATDDLGRSLPTYEEVGPIRTNKTVAMFYWTWHVGLSQNSKAYDLSQIITDPAMVNDYNHPNWDPYTDGNAFHWGESVFDHYDGKDKWVIRKQLEMLADAGVDVLFYDATNGNVTWKEGYEAVGQVMAEMRAEGLEVPQFAFMLNFGAIQSTAESLVQLYDELYNINKYQDSWFMWNGKPAIMAYPEVCDNSYPADAAGMKFTATSAFSGVDANCPSYSDNSGDLTLSLYTWTGSYAASVAQVPLASQTFVDFNDNAFLKLEFGSLSAGDYVWELTDAREVVGVWKYPDETAGINSYFNGTSVSGDYKSRVKYVSAGFFSALTSGASTVPVQINAGLDPAKLAAIKTFFTFRPGQPDYESGPVNNTQWGWLENAPQNGYVNQGGGQYEWMTVGVAQNWSESANQLSAMNGPNIHGRSYTAAGGFSQLTTNSYLHGYNFQEQWDRALAVDPDMVFITGWNEWVAGRYETWQGVNNAFPDQFDAEYSRDIEPMKGGYGDNYYYQMVSNIRKFKGMEKPEVASAPTSIAIDGAFADWAGVKPEFKVSRGNVQLRDGYGYLDTVTGLPIHYTNNSARNDIVGAKVARDGFDLYFHVEASTNLTTYTDPNWMQLLIDIDRNKATGWEGYDLMVDRYAADGTAMLSTSSGGWSWTDLAAVEYSTAAAELELSIPRVLLGLPSGQPVDLEFKWFDAPNMSGDIMEVYTEGEAAPSGRFNFHYQEEPQVIFADSFDVIADVWDNLNTELPTRQAEGVTNGTYTLGLTSGNTLVGSAAALGEFLKPVLVRVNTSGGGGGHAALDLDTDFGGILNGSTWTLSYKGRIDASVGFTGWAGFSVGNPADTPSGAGTGFGFNMHSDGTYQAWTNGTLVADVADIYSIAGLHYTLAATFDEAVGIVQLTYSDAVVGNTDLGTFPTAFAGGSRFVELRNHVDTSTGDGIVDMRYDDLSISVLASETLYPDWAQGHGLSTTNALFTADTDGDSLDNLAEYALGGDPNIDDAAAILPTSGFTPDWGTYVYNRRSDATTRSLTYGMAYKLDLLDPVWIYVGSLWETSTNAVDASFDSVTNEIPITGLGKGFIQLEIKGN